jgi:Ca2+-binding EF-hand superfamily protein
VFAAADKNKDGTLTKSEIKNYFRTQPADKEALLKRDFHWSSVWGEMDEDGNGTLDLGEFTHMAIRVIEAHL